MRGNSHVRFGEEPRGNDPKRAPRRAAYSTPNLHERLQTMPWNQASVIHYDRSAGHGRKDTRVLTVLTVHDLDFPHVQQIVRVVRHSKNITTGKRTRQTVYLITSLTSAQASPERLARLARSHWLIENGLHC